MVELGVFLPVLNNGWVISTAAPQYHPSYAMNKAMTLLAEDLGFSFVLSPVKYRGFGGPTEHWDYVLESFEVMAALAEATDLFAQAGQAFRDGKHAEAIRLALLALIARLEKQGLLRYDTTRTNREYQRELCQRADLAARFGQLARIYDRVWYGRASAGAAEAEQAISLCGSVINREDLVPE